MDVKILVAYHKSCWLPQDSVYLPVCTAPAASAAGNGDPALPDGRAACASRPALCELQALQWARAHLAASHVGLCHYRRFFGKAAPALAQAFQTAQTFQRFRAFLLPRMSRDSCQDSAASLHGDPCPGGKVCPDSRFCTKNSGHPARLGVQAPHGLQDLRDGQDGRDAALRLLDSQDLAARRQRIFGRTDFERLLARFDIVLPRRRRYVIETVASHYAHAHHAEELDVIRGVLLDRQPSSLPAFREVMERRWLYLCNMFAMAKPLFDEYADWLFPILEDFEERLAPARYPTPYERRAPAFMAERLFNVWLAQSRLRAVECPVVLLGRANWPRKVLSFLWRKFVQPGRRS